MRSQTIDARLAAGSLVARERQCMTAFYGALLEMEIFELGEGAAAVYCRDPFGTIIELMSVRTTLASLDHLE
jgi:hypothetical protein